MMTRHWHSLISKSSADSRATEESVTQVTKLAVADLPLAPSSSPSTLAYNTFFYTPVLVLFIELSNKIPLT
jgi:hypothetical protein